MPILQTGTHSPEKDAKRLNISLLEFIDREVIKKFKRVRSFYKTRSSALLSGVSCI